MALTDVYAKLAAAKHCAPGCSPKELVWESGKLRLFRYRPTAPSSGAAPLLIVYALVNRPYMMDLQEDRSLIRGLLDAGLPVYLIDWGYPDGADRFTTLADYINRLLAGCVEQVLAAHRLDALNVLGVCQGGVRRLGGRRQCIGRYPESAFFGADAVPPGPPKIHGSCARKPGSSTDREFHAR